jgi:hypothetical protein
MHFRWVAIEISARLQGASINQGLACLGSLCLYVFAGTMAITLEMSRAFTRILVGIAGMDLHDHGVVIRWSIETLRTSSEENFHANGRISQSGQAALK